jgi:zinc protease
VNLLIEENHDLPLVDVDALVAVGHAHDPPGKEGLARHSFELLRRGAGGKSRAEIDAALDDLGAEVSTSHYADGIAYSVRCLARNVEPALALLRDVLFRPALAEDEHQRLVREGLASLDDMRDDDATLASRYFDRYALAGHPYGRTGLGTQASLESLTRDDAAAWVERNVHAASMVLGFAGDLTAARAEALAAATLAAAPAARVLPAALPAVAPAERRTILVDKPERAQANVVIGHAAPPPSHADAIALSVASTAFGGTFTSRLVSEVRVKRGWSYSVGCRVLRARAGHTFRIRVVPSADRVVDTLALVLDLYAAFAAAGPSDEEVEFAKSYLCGGHAFDVATASDRLERRVEGALWGLPADHHATIVGRLAAVTPDEVRAATTRWLRPDASVTTIVASADAIELADAEVVPYDSY